MTSLMFTEITQNKTPQNLLPTKVFNYLVFRNVQSFIHTKFFTVFFRDLAPYEVSCTNARVRIRKMESFPIPGRVFATVVTSDNRHSES